MVIEPNEVVILVVDDNEVGRYTKTRILRQAGFTVIQSASGADALAAVSERKPRLVVLDVQLPDINGWEICRRIKADADTASVLVLQVSATYVSEVDTVHALEGGADGCLTEPIEPPVLVATVRALLRARQAEDALRAAVERAEAAQQEAEAANRTKDEFLATLSHELRSPLNAILTWVTLLRTGKLDDARSARAFEAIDRNTRVQVRLIEDLLDVSRIISGNMRLDVGWVDLASIVESTVEALRPAEEAKGLRIDAVIDPTLGPISGDAARLQQIVWNLLSNAVKFTPKGGHVAVRVEAVQSHAQIRVTDTGKGIEPAFLPHIFERFQQADSSTTRREGGLGLGLAIVRHLVELHGGTVEAESAGPGTGATFVVKLPLPALTPTRYAPGDLPHDDVGAAQSAEAFPSLDTLHVLVVDDDVDARDAVAAALEGCGATVTVAGSAAEALSQLERGTPNVLVSDIAMPVEDGVTLISRIRELGTDPTQLPAIALTAYAGAADRARMLAAGYQAHLTKPIEARDLVAAVGRFARQPLKT